MPHSCKPKAQNFVFPQSPLEPCSLSHEAQGKPCLYSILPRSGKISRGNFGKCCQCGNVASYQCCQFPIGEPVASGAAVAGRPPYPAARRDASPHHAAVTVDDLQRAVEEVKRTVRKAKREIIEDSHTARESEADRRRVPTGERSNQIAAVRKLMREARASGKKMSILRACRAVWRDVNGGYPSPEALYDYCHSHKTEF